MNEELLRTRVKAELRGRMRGLRSALSLSACSSRSEQIRARLLSLELVARARTVALFSAIEAQREVDLMALDEHLRQLGVRIAYPRVERGTRSMTFRFVTDPGLMGEDSSHAMGLREPSPSDPQVMPGELDVIVVPALAVDPSGQRIGYGAGYYDRVLAQFVPPATSIAVAFDFQLVAELPRTQEDVQVHYIVTDARVLQATRSR